MAITVSIEDENTSVKVSGKVLSYVLHDALRCYQYAGIEGCPMELIADMATQFAESTSCWEDVKDTAQPLEMMVRYAALFLCAVEQERKRKS